MPNTASSTLVLEPYSEEATIRAARQCLQQLGRNPDLAVLFVSADYRPFLDDFLELIQLHAHALRIVGCSTTGLIATDHEVEAASGFSLLLLSLPNTEIQTFNFTEEMADNFGHDDWKHFLGNSIHAEAWISLASPIKVATEPWLNALSKAISHAPVFGGLASGGQRGDDIFVFEGHRQIEAGVLVSLKGGFQLHTIVSQGCRPIGEPHPITSANENVIHSIGSTPAYERLEESFESLSPEDKSRAAGNIFAGLALNEYVDDFAPSDFLIRSLLAADKSSGDIVLAAYPRTGQTLQFQLRDRQSAHSELHRMLDDAREERAQPIAALAFLCGGRGTGLFQTPNHDVAAFSARFGSIPLAGMFCNAEIGPVNKRNFVHGYTAVFGLLT